MKYLLLVLVLVSSFSGRAVAGPFGLRWGASKAEVAQVLDTRLKFENILWAGGFLYQTSVTLEEMDKKAIVFSVIFSPDDELIGIQAIRGFSTSNLGTELKNGYAYYLEVLTDKYGSPTITSDFLVEGSIWIGPGQFMRGLRDKERVLRAEWHFLDDATHGIKWLSLETAASSLEKGYVEFYYSTPALYDLYEREKEQERDQF